MRTETTTRELYQFEELDEKAKEKAREWWRETSQHDDFWSECCIDDCKERLALLGFGIAHVYWSGFWSQGDGACFEGRWHAWDCKKEGLDRLKMDYSESDPFVRYGEVLVNLAGAYPQASASIKQDGHYYHEFDTRFECDGFATDAPEDETGEDARSREDADGMAEEAFIEASRGCMREIYKALERDYNWHNADEQVDDTIIANEYEFTKEGERA